MSKITIKRKTLTEEYNSPYTNLKGVGPNARALAAVNKPLCIGADYESSRYFGPEFQGLIFRVWHEPTASMDKDRQLTKPFYILDYDLFHKVYDKALLESVQIHENKVTLSDIFNADGSFIKKGVWGAIKEFYDPGHRYYRQKSTICDAICAMVDLWDLVYKQIPTHPDYPVYTWAEAQKLMTRVEDIYITEEEEDRITQTAFRTHVRNELSTQKDERKKATGITNTVKASAILDQAQALVRSKDCVEGLVIFADQAFTETFSAKILPNAQVAITHGLTKQKLITQHIPIFMCMKAALEENGKYRDDCYANYYSYNKDAINKLDLEDELLPVHSPARAGFGYTSVEYIRNKSTAANSDEFWSEDNFNTWAVEEVIIDKKDYDRFSKDPEHDWSNDKRRQIAKAKADYQRGYGWLEDPDQNGMNPKKPDGSTSEE